MSTVSPWAACTTLAGLYARQLLRSRSVWIGVFFMCMPAALALLVGRDEPREAWTAAAQSSASLLALVPALFAAGIIADELSEHTYTYLFSRPIRRWTIFVGKLGCAAAAATGVLAGSAIAAAAVSPHVDGMMRFVAAMAVGSVAVSAVVAGVGTLIIRHPIVAAIVYMLLIDVPIGHAPFDGRYLSLTFHVRELGGIGEIGVPTWVSLGWLVGFAVGWAAIALWRLSRLEATTSS